MLTKESLLGKEPKQIVYVGHVVLAQNLGVLDDVLVGANFWKSESGRLNREQDHLPGGVIAYNTQWKKLENMELKSVVAKKKRLNFLLWM